MTLGQKVMEALEEAKEKGALEHLEEEGFSVRHDGIQVTLGIVDFDRLGFLLNGINVEWGAAMSAATTKAHAERIAHRVTYLTEDLTLVEWTEERADALLRSTPQEMQGKGSDYFELSLRGGRTLELRRYRPCADVPRRREEIPFHLTADLLGRLFNDFEVQPSSPAVAV